MLRVEIDYCWMREGQKSIHSYIKAWALLIRKRTTTKNQKKKNQINEFPDWKDKTNYMIICVLRATRSCYARVVVCSYKVGVYIYGVFCYHISTIFSFHLKIYIYIRYAIKHFTPFSVCVNVTLCRKMCENIPTCNQIHAKWSNRYQNISKKKKKQKNPYLVLFFGQTKVIQSLNIRSL